MILSIGSSLQIQYYGQGIVRSPCGSWLAGYHMCADRSALILFKYIGIIHSGQTGVLPNEWSI